MIKDAAAVGRCHPRGRSAIGIGGSLTAPPLPHHRAYGSVHGGSTELSGMGRRAFGFGVRRAGFGPLGVGAPGFTLRHRLQGQFQLDVLPPGPHERCRPTDPVRRSGLRRRAGYYALC